MIWRYLYRSLYKNAKGGHKLATEEYIGFAGKDSFSEGGLFNQATEARCGPC